MFFSARSSSMEGDNMKESRSGDRIDRFARLEDIARSAGPITMGIVYPTDATSLSGALAAAEAGLIHPVLIGPSEDIHKVALDAGFDIEKLPVEEAKTPLEAAKKAVDLACEGKVDALMKGALHTDNLMHPIVANTAMRTDRRISHVFAMDVPSYERLLFISDAAINVHPNLGELRDITCNAIDLAHALGTERPKVALLSCTENVSEKIESTVFAAAICKMADRGAIAGADIDGPLAMDNAVSPEAAKIKGITSSVAGHADILIVPDLISGNILAKDLDYLAGADAAGIVMGAAVPIALTSRADGDVERRASAALACLVAAWKKRGRNTP
jgi:phosphate acetyltransferase/phosphate butyryltransferase